MAISPEVRRILGVPDYYLDEAHITSMTTHWCVIDRIMDAVRPQSICEIGAQRGLVTQLVSEKAFDLGATHVVVDPVVTEGVRRVRRAVIHEARSVDYLRTAAPSDVYLLDGDHNYETVIAELRLIKERRASGRPLCVVLHDVSWPCAYRDMYYDPSSLASPLPHAWDPVLSIDDEAVAETRVLERQGHAFAVRHGGERNGVAGAIEDFLREAGADFEYFSFPTVYGLGVLYDKKSLPSSAASTLASIKDEIGRLAPMLGILEANRLRMLQAMEDVYRERQALEDRIGGMKWRLDRIDAVKKHPLVAAPYAVYRFLRRLRHGIA